jgi:hypothetical protein
MHAKDTDREPTLKRLGLHTHDLHSVVCDLAISRQLDCQATAPTEEVVRGQRVPFSTPLRDTKAIQTLDHARRSGKKHENGLIILNQ